MILCEGEFDRLVLKGQGFMAVTSTAGAGVFRPEWAEDFDAIPEVYLCFDRDEAGALGAARVGGLVPHAKVVMLPEELGRGGDITDFFVQLRRSAADFEALLADAAPFEPAEQSPEEPRELGAILPASPMRERIEALKRALPIERLVGRSVALTPSGGMFVGLCPFHEDHVPSFTVYPKSQTFHCFGCRRHGDVIDFYREREQVGFKEALAQLEEMMR